MSDVLQYPVLRPEGVEQALLIAEELGFPTRPDGNRPDESGSASCCIDAVGSLLRTLCAALPGGSIGEIGTGAGVGTAWLASSLVAGATLTSVELDPRLHEAVRGLFADDDRVRLVLGDWRHEFRRHGPFDLLFADGGGVGGSSPDEWGTVAELVPPGGMMVLDDLTPESLWPESWRGQPDSKRELAFNSGYFTATELRTGDATSALLMVRC